MEADLHFSHAQVAAQFLKAQLQLDVGLCVLNWINNNNEHNNRNDLGISF